MPEAIHPSDAVHQRMIRLDRIEAGVLQRVRLKFRNQPDAAALLVFVNHQPASFFRDRGHRHLQLIVAIASQ